MDENKFFSEATKTICSTLNTNEAMKNSLLFLKEYLPADGILLAQHQFEQSILKIIVHATLGKEENPDVDLKMPAGYREIADWIQEGQIRTINRPEENFVARVVTQWLGFANISYLVMHLRIDGQSIGQLALYSCKKNAYSDHHMKIFSILQSPFTFAMSNALKTHEITNLNIRLQDDNKFLYHEALLYKDENIIGGDSGLKDVVEQIRQVAPTKSPVLLTGETGVGKEVIANAIHQLSPRKDKPFIKVNCGAISEYLIDSELFGHEKGAFTGAVSRRRGLFERAHEGTILLDEIGELPLQAQVRLLRVLQSGEIERVGGTQTIPIDVRVVAATHRNLSDMTTDKTFREDLYFRLNVFPVHIPSLRERPEDISKLVRYFIDLKMKELGIQKRPEVGPEVMERLTRDSWPGNVRELENKIERALIRYRSFDEGGPLIFEEDTADHLHKNSQEDASIQSQIIEPLDDVIISHIKRALRKTDGQIHGKGGAAELLGINPNTLRSKMRKLRLFRK